MATRLAKSPYMLPEAEVHTRPQLINGHEGNINPIRKCPSVLFFCSQIVIDRCWKKCQDLSWKSCNEFFYVHSRRCLLSTPFGMI